MENKLHNEICPHCKHIMPTMINQPGEYCVCWRCLATSVLQADLSLKIATDQDMVNIKAYVASKPEVTKPMTNEDLGFVRFLTKIHIDKQTKTYSIGKDKKGNEFILCFTCDKASYNTNDIKYKYCGNCHKFHE